jgi:cell wall-associated NlpC family hydrolase
MRYGPALLSSLALAAALGAVLPARAAPDSAPPGDAVLQLLQERGLVPRLPGAAALQASPVVQQVRDATTELVVAAMNFLGVRYRRGGNSVEDGFDCSGFTRHVFEHSLGLVLPRRSDDQARLPGLMAVTREELKPGDLVFFNTMKRAFSHVGIYVGDGRFIHAPRSGSEVRIEDMRTAYWARRYDGARRAAAAAEPAGPAPGAATDAADAVAARR